MVSSKILLLPHFGEGNLIFLEGKGDGGLRNEGNRAEELG